MKKDTALSVSKSILLILKEIGSGTIQAFFPPKYAAKYGYSRKRSTYWTSADFLVRKGYIRKEGDIFYLTSEGEKEAFLVSLRDFARQNKNIKRKTEKWDGKWRIIFFDVPEKKRRYRDELRSMIRAIGFREFQKSIWIYPYKVPKFLSDIMFEENIKHYTRLITTDKIEYDKDIRRMFKLN